MKVFKKLAICLMGCKQWCHYYTDFGITVDFLMEDRWE